MKINNKYLKRSLFVVVVFMLVAFSAPTSERYFEIAKNLDIFATLFKEVNTFYVDGVEPEKLIEKGISGMLESLDPYTSFIPEDDIEDYRTMTTGQYGGIGAIVGRRRSQNVVMLPYEGFPAHKSGLKAGDVILEIDGIDVTGKNTSEVSKLLKGQAGTDLKVKIERMKSEEPIDVAITREKITIDNVPYYGMIDDEIGYIKLSDFTTGAGREVQKAFEALKEQGLKKLIFDLRDNPGGLLTEAVNVSNIFVPKGSDIVSTKGKVKDWNKTYKALNNPVDTEIPVAVLTSRRSASASEIVAGVIQDYDRGILVGQKTFGKGLVQATRPLTYNAQLKITTAKYYIPSGRCIQALDYSNRDENGSVGAIPDSLKIAFKTQRGRTVYDGGGVDPDILVDTKQYAPITISLMGRNHIFDYATIFYYNQDEVKSARDFEVSDAQYDEFVAWLADKEYDYTTRVERDIEDLIASAKKEKYYEAIDDQIVALQNKVMHNKEADLQKFKEEVKQMMKEEIVGRYFYQKGIVEASFSDDAELEAAVKALKDEKKYNELLTDTNSEASTSEKDDEKE